MNAYSTNRNWSDRFLPEIKRLVGGHLLETAPDPFDHFQATDLMMLDARDMRVAARVRRPGYAQRYPHQFTIRSRVASGAQTELSKIVEDKGDWMFYGHSDARRELVVDRPQSIPGSADQKRWAGLQRCMRRAGQP